MIKLILLTLALTLTSFAQNPDLSKFEVVGIAGDTAFLVSKDRKVKKRTIEFALLIAEANTEGPGLSLNPNNYMLAPVEGNCEDMTYSAGKKTGKKHGEPYSEDATKKRPAPIDSRIWQVLNFVCKPDSTPRT
jgi:hypothetical protein